MRKFVVFGMIIFMTATPVFAALTTYSHTVGVMTVLDNYWWDGESEIYTTWEHSPLDNPYPGGSDAYDQALLAGEIEGTSLTIAVDDLDFGNSASVMFQDKDGIWHGLGYLNTMSYADEFGLVEGPGNGVDVVDAPGSHLVSTTFELDPDWLDSVSVNAQVNWEQFGGLNQMEIETATLSITSIVPAPSAILLCGIGTGIVGWLRRRRKL